MEDCGFRAHHEHTPPRFGQVGLTGWRWFSNGTQKSHGNRSESIRGVVPYQRTVSAEEFDVPTEGAHPQNPDLEDDSPAPRVGWQRPASSRLERQCASEMWPVFNQTERALMLSQSGPMCGEPFTCFPSIKETRFNPQSFRLLLLRCLRLPLPLTARCQCGRLLDSCGHHRAACARVGILGRWGFALERAASRVCREAGGRVMTNMLVRELDLAPGANTRDGRRLEVVADGLSLFQGAQLAIDTTLVSALRADGTPRPRAATTPGAALDDARTRKETTYPEPSWSSLLQKAADVGLRRRHNSLVRWRRPKHGQRQRSCKRRGRTLGGTVGEGCWLVPRQKLSKVLCSNTALLSLLQVTSRLCTM